MLRSLAHTLQAGFNAEDAANGKVKPENDTFEPIQELEALVKDYKETISALEQELKDARAHPVMAAEVQAKQRLLTQRLTTLNRVGSRQSRHEAVLRLHERVRRV